MCTWMYMVCIYEPYFYWKFLWNLNIREMMHKKRKLWNYSLKECNIINSFSEQKLLWRLWIIPKSHLQNFSLSLLTHNELYFFFCKSLLIFLQLDFKSYLLLQYCMKLQEIFCKTLKQDLNTLLENCLFHCGT